MRVGIGISPQFPNSLSGIAKALAQFGFHAPLTEDVFLDKGYGAASFTRATTATVKDWEGGILNCLSGEVRFAGQRRVRNRVTTEDFSNANWSVTGTATKVGNASITGPDGTTVTAMEVSFGATASSLFYNSVTGITGHTAVLSCWVRAKSGSTTIRMTANNAFTSNITVTETWQRLSASEVYAGGSTSSVVANNSSGTSGNVYVYHPQLEIFSPSSSNQNPSEYVSVGANKLNELTYTEEFDNGVWSKTQITATAGQSDPLGGAGAELLAEAAAAANHYLQSPSTASLPNTTNMVVSVYAKKGPGATAPDIVQLAFLGALSNTAYANFNINTGTVGTSSGCTSSIVNVGNGWYRLVATLATSSAATAQALLVFTNNNDGLGRVPSYLGVTTSNVYAFGFHVERGTTPSTYFPVGNVYPYHGACVDGVKYFSTLNGNTVASNVVTEATGAAITRPENDGLTNGLVLGGQSSGNNATTPDSAALSITGDMEIEMDFHKPSINGYIASKSSDSCATHGWELLFSSTPKLYLKWFDGTATRSASPVAAWPYSTTTRGQAKVVLDVDNGAGGCAVSYYYRPDSNAAWVLLETVTQAFTTAIVDSAVALAIGSNPPGAIGHGEYYRCIIRNGINGTTVFDADFTAQEIGTTSFTESSSNAATVTINRNGAVPAYIGNPLRLFNYEGYLAESARTNLVLQSSNFGTTWGSVGSPTRSAAAAYCGEIALDLIGDDDAVVMESYYQFITFTADASKSVSFLVKQGTSASSVMQIQDATAGANRLLMAITWSGGVPVCTYTTGSAERASEYMGGGVWRIFCLAAGVIAANNNWCYVYPATVAGLTAAGTGDIYIGGVQAENYPNASASHIPTTTATVTRNADFLSYPLAGNISESLGAMYAELATHSSQVGNYAGLMGNNATRVFNWQNGTQFTDGTAATSAAGGSVWTPPQSPSKAACSWSASGNSKVAVSNGVLSTLNLTYDGTINFGTSLEIGARAAGAADCMEGIVRNARAALVKPTDADLQLITQ